MTLKVINWHFLIVCFKADVDLTKLFLLKSAMFHSIRLPFDAEVDEIFLNVIYYVCSKHQIYDGDFDNYLSM